jgi:hypothetical protein
MRMTPIIATICTGLLLASGAGQRLLARSDKASAKVIVPKEKVTFDPKTCAAGSAGGLSDGNGTGSVKILGRRDGHCEFDYFTSGCGGVTSHYRCKVPYGGIVKIEIVNGSIQTSFPLDKAKLLRSTGPVIEILVGDTGEYVKYHPHERRSEMELRKGDKVKFRFRVYDGAEFKQLLPKAAFDPSVEFVVGSEGLAVAGNREREHDRRRPAPGPGSREDRRGREEVAP